MWTSTRRTPASHATRWRPVGVAVALLTCFGLAACTATEPPPPATTAEADTIAPFPESGAIDAGTYLVTGYPVPFQITVPDGWETFDGASLGKDDPDLLPNSWDVALFFYPVAYVPTDACAWNGALVQIDPTAEALVDAMAAQASTVSTPAVEVMVGDYAGFEFEHAAESDVDFTNCDDDTLCIYSDLAQECNGRGYETVGERDTYRAVDLNGERAVIALVQPDESLNPALRKEARAVFDSIKFLGPRPTLENASVWGADGMYLVVDGVPYVGTQPWPEVGRIGSFTVVPSGVVYVDPAASQVIWKGWDRQTEVIGDAPRRVGSEGAWFWGGAVRDLVGSPSEDLVAWVETDGDQRGDLVVVQPSTGAVLARTAVPGPPDRVVMLAGVDEETVYFATPPTLSTFPMLGSEVWSWRWAAGEPPRSSEHGAGTRSIFDVAGGVWAVRSEGGLSFQDAAGTVLSEAPLSYLYGPGFSYGLSPDGRYWFAPEPHDFVATATGERVPFQEPYLNPMHGWLGPTSFTIIGGAGEGLAVCDPRTGTCTEPVPIRRGSEYALPAY